MVRTWGPRWLRDVRAAQGAVELPTSLLEAEAVTASGRGQSYSLTSRRSALLDGARIHLVFKVSQISFPLAPGAPLVRLLAIPIDGGYYA